MEATRCSETSGRVDLVRADVSKRLTLLSLAYLFYPEDGSETLLRNVGQSFDLSISSRPALGTTIQGREADHSPQTSVEVKRTRIYTSTTQYAFMASV
jgi:hypothetical protein